MPEISARDLRRLTALDERLRREQEEKRKLVAEGRALRGRLDRAESAAREDRERLEALLEENRRLAGEVEAGSADLDRAVATAAQAREAAEAANAQMKRTAAELKEARGEVRRLTRLHAQLAERLKGAEAQLRGRGVEPIVPAGRVADLVTTFVKDLRGGLGGLDVNQGELRLKLGVGLVDDQPGFVLPTPSSSAETISQLHEVTLRFDRRLDELDDLR